MKRKEFFAQLNRKEKRELCLVSLALNQALHSVADLLDERGPLPHLSSFTFYGASHSVVDFPDEIGALSRISHS